MDVDSIKFYELDNQVDGANEHEKQCRVASLHASSNLHSVEARKVA